MSRSSSTYERVISATARIGTACFETVVSMPNDHELRADEPVPMGGTDLGPTPMDLMLAGLAACKVMTLRTYADRKGWPLTGAEVRAVHHRVKASEAPEGDVAAGRVDVIDCEIVLEGAELTDEQRNRLYRSIEACNVHRCLTHATTVSARLVEE